MYEKSKQYQRERKEKKLRQLEELTSSVKTDLSLPQLLERTQSVLSVNSDAPNTPFRRAASSSGSKTRLKEGYPLSRADAKRRKEERFRMLEQKTQEYRREYLPDPPAMVFVSPYGPYRDTASSSSRSVKRRPKKTLLDLTVNSCLMPDGLDPSSWEYPIPDLTDEWSDVAASKLLKVKNEVRKRKEEQQREEARKQRDDDKRKLESRRKQEAARIAALAATAYTAEIAKATSSPKSVRFADKLVTDVHYRPKTRPEDIEKLYFIEEELDELEWDRQTVEGDVFELVAGDESVSVTYQNRRHLLRRKQPSAHDDDTTTSNTSDTSAFYE